jgi:hypothetical protein
MSPVSRGRKLKKNTKTNTGKRTRRGRPPFAEADLPAPSCDCPVCWGDDVDSTGLIDSLLGDAASLVASEDPLDAEVAGAALTSTVTLAIGQIDMVDDQAGDHVLVDGLIPAFEARASTEAMALLLALGSVAPDPVGAAASAAGHRLAHAGVTRPSWADELTTPVAIGPCHRLMDPAGTGAILAASFTRAGRSHAVLVCVDGLDCGAAAEIALLDADELPDALAIIRSTHPDPAGESGDLGEIVEETLDATEWRWQVDNALDARAVHDHTDGLTPTGWICTESTSTLASSTWPTSTTTMNTKTKSRTSWPATPPWRCCYVSGSPRYRPRPSPNRRTMATTVAPALTLRRSRTPCNS